MATRADGLLVRVPSAIERRRLIVRGIVQGVGFRPFVYGLALRCGLIGFVRNDSTGVTIEVEGDSEALTTFQQAVQTEAPPLARIDSITSETVPARDDTSFRIAKSKDGATRCTLISPDVATCDDCLRELFDPTDRRFRYPFINCTNCGPRFTIVQDVPYDRHLTTMRVFLMCPACQADYDNHLDRRFHAQPNACPNCGPQVALVASHSVMASGDAAIRRVQQLLADGAIVAVKGLGGYHLACDATNAGAVTRLRSRKHREDKPFALMARDLATVEMFCEVNSDEAALLASRQRPIVLLRKRVPCPIAEPIAPAHRYLGFMLPYTPLHHLLLEDGPPALVMTSGNVSDEPIAYRDDDAFERLAGIADAFLTHNREIHVRCDDSIVQLLGTPETRRTGARELGRYGDKEKGRQGETDRSISSLPPISPSPHLVVRRSRGYAPQPITLSFECPEQILAVGAHLKNTFCLTRGRHAFVSHHIGDLENLETLTSFRDGIEHFKRLFDIHPTIIAYDMHPEYLATKYALDKARTQCEQGAGVELVAVQHHHAHIASVIAEHRLNDEPVIGVAFDGTGYGTDAHIWGGEFLIADCIDFTRAAHLTEMPLPGGEAAIRQPWRTAAAHLYALYGSDFTSLNIPFVQTLDHRRWHALRQMIDRDVNSPRTSSMGRLFDAVSALVGVRSAINYEGQAAIELEQIADEHTRDAYSFAIEAEQPYRINPQPIIAGVVTDLLDTVPPACIATRFHNTIAALIVTVCETLRGDTGYDRVALSGGVFQNRLLLSRTLPLLRDAGFDVYLNSSVPANDGGISFGQAIVAAARLRANRNIEEGEQLLCA